jgi:hypothetical protein
VGWWIAALLFWPWPALAQNLVQNGDFSSNLDGWASFGSGVASTWDSSDASGASGSAKLTASSANPQGGIQQAFAVTAGYSYEFTASHRGTPGAGSVIFGFGNPFTVTYGVINNLWRSDSQVLHAMPGVTSGSVRLAVERADSTAYIDAVRVVQLPTAIREFRAQPASIAQGQCASLFVGASSATSLTIDQGVGALPQSFNAQWVVPNRCPTATTTYTLTISGPTGTVIGHATITVVPPPTATLSATPASISEGEAATLAWTTAHATSVSIDNVFGSVPASGTASVAPSTTTTYTLTASGIGGTTTKQVSVTVTPPKPQITFTASPRTIAEGERSTLAWNVLNATSISIDHGIGSRSVSGSTSASPAETTTYKLTATGPGGSSSAQVTVTVLSAPVISFSATPSAITRGGASTLTWTVMEATLVVIDHGIGAQPPTGALVVRPTETTTYLLTASGPGGVRLGQATITVNAVGRRRSVRH